ncbi:hypothetical protein OIV83_006319 [Microbotryomycetes sp. JL201]|nr:hypothetical protein OIV83_006319 [Microbotryomycetes sp. JL201]
MTPAPYTTGDKAPASTAASQSTAAPGPHVPSNVFPALHLIPLNDTFVPKQISLHPPGTRIKIGRQTNAKTVPNGTNGYFDSKVLSRMHAEVWSEDDKVLIKDVKSSNGTFIDGQRLSPEAAESDIFELRTGSTVEFGIDIVSDDSKTVVHHKVSAKVIVVLNADDAMYSSREFNAWYRQASEQASQRRNARNIGGAQANGLSFEHVFNRLQGELQKSRDTSSHLGELTSALNDVHETLGGAPPPPNFHQRGLPSYMGNGHYAGDDAHAQSIAALQSQLNETQSSLASHIGKIQELEGLLAEHDAIKREVGVLRAQMEDAKRDMEHMLRVRDMGGERDVDMAASDGRESPVAKLLDDQTRDDEDDDDTRSISSVDTVTPSASGTRGGMFGTSEHTGRDESARSRERQLAEQNAALSSRLEALSSELEEAVKLGETLRTRHAEATETIKLLEDRVQGLEKAVETRTTDADSRILQEMENRWTSWREAFEESVRKERKGWQDERAQLMRLVTEWEGSKGVSDSDNGSDNGSDDGASSSVPEGAASTSKRANNSRAKRRRRSQLSKVGVGERGPALLTESRTETSPAGTTRPLPSAPGSDGRPSGHSPDLNSFAGTRIYASAGAVVLISVAAAWALSVKMKE